MTRTLRTLSFLMLDRHVRVTCRDDHWADIVRANYAALLSPRCERPPDLEFMIEGHALSRRHVLHQRGRCSVAEPRASQLLFRLEKAVTLSLQELRSDLLFFHAAALTHEGRAILLVGESGHGKSTTAWGLLHHGFDYLSDELGPVELPSLQVRSYAHALCMKRLPPAGYALPATGAMDLGATLHVPVDAMPARVGVPSTLGAVVFVRHDRTLSAPAWRAVGAAEASARLYAQALNALAHPAKGVDVVVDVATRVPCYALDTADLRLSCELLRDQVWRWEPRHRPAESPRLAA
jgi:hypothetical protein